MKHATLDHVLFAALAIGIGACLLPAHAEETPAAPPVPALAPTTVTSSQSTWLQEYFGDELIKADGSKATVDSLSGKTIGIYFSAHWCPPCRRFTPVLVEARNAMVAAGKPFEIVFASSDRSPEAMTNYMAEASMPWAALPHGSEERNNLKKKYGVRGIPTLVIIDEKGELITKGGRGDVSKHGVAAFDNW